MLNTRPVTELYKAYPALPTQDDLPTEDGIPMETQRHRIQMELLISTLDPYLRARGRGYVNGNMFVYFDPAQARDKYFRGPDVFVVLDATPEFRKSWVVWDEGKRPDIIIELLSDSTAKDDKNLKKQVYQTQLQAPEYYWYNPFDPEDFVGFELHGGVYRPMPFDSRHRLISSGLKLALVRWHGIYRGEEAVWLRWATLAGELLPAPEENAEQAKRYAAKAGEHAAKAEKHAVKAEKRADQAEKLVGKAEERAGKAEARADQAEAEAERLRALLQAHGISP